MARDPHSYQDIAVDFDKLPKSRLESMQGAGLEAIDYIRVLSKMGDNIVGELLDGAEGFYEWDHYPDGDVYDHETHAQFYYHAHPQELRGGEHGHFHTFMRANGIPDTIGPAALPDYQKPAEKKRKPAEKNENSIFRNSRAARGRLRTRFTGGYGAMVARRIPDPKVGGSNPSRFSSHMRANGLGV